MTTIEQVQQGLLDKASELLKDEWTLGSSGDVSAVISAFRLLEDVRRERKYDENNVD